PATEGGEGEGDVVPDERAAALERAWEAYRSADYERARGLLQPLRAADPDDPESLYLAGLIGLAAGDLEAAIDELEDAAGLGEARAGFYLGFALYELGDRAAARRALEHFLRVADERDSRLAVRARGLLKNLERGEDKP
ncbi:MAG: hypothetical protein D6696_17365, partial [Acidobacteria bacterium]